VADGSIIWSVPGNRDTDHELNFFCRPAVKGTRIYCSGGDGVVTAFDDNGGSYTQAWEYRDHLGEYTAVSGVKTPDGRQFVYAVMQEDIATNTLGALLVLHAPTLAPLVQLVPLALALCAAGWQARALRRLAKERPTHAVSAA